MPIEASPSHSALLQPSICCERLNVLGVARRFLYGLRILTRSFESSVNDDGVATPGPARVKTRLPACARRVAINVLQGQVHVAAPLEVVADTCARIGSPPCTNRCRYAESGVPPARNQASRSTVSSSERGARLSAQTPPQMQSDGAPRRLPVHFLGFLQPNNGSRIL